ncbi:alcohol oxidase-like protein [Thozetella sp. PMI_491]|nr:alcohol oxidase-like protein [Thozetella sp. PMI_491]
MGLYTQLPSNITEVDVIIAGGGTAACVIAARLSDADPNLSILVLEGGPNNFNMPEVIYPALFFANLQPNSKTALFHMGNKSPSTANRDMIIPSGGLLGGGSSINFLTYSRAQRSDWDSWNMTGWSADEMIPFLKKLETFHGPGSKEVHGYSGPVHISNGGFGAAEVADDLIQAAEKVGWPEKEDTQGLGATNGMQRALRYISPEGKRQDAAHRYIHPRLRDDAHPNLHILVESQVERVLFDGKKAVGITYRPNPAFLNQDISASSASRTVKARRMVVVSCGSAVSPLLLERSGVGRSEILEKAGVPVVAALLGVGDSYRDHPGMIYAYKSDLNPTQTMDNVLRGEVNIGQMIQENNPLLGWNAMDMTSKLRPSDADIAALGPEFQQYWDNNYKNIPDKPLSIITLVEGFPGDPTGVPPGQYLGFTTFSTYPRSTGSIHITGPGIDAPADFDVGFLSDDAGIDIKKARWAYKTQREMARRMNHYRGEWAPWHPPFPPGSKAACTDTDGPLPDDVANVEYSAEDDAVIDQYVREKVSSFWHSSGTCRMAPQEQGGVVDASLNVYGVEGLKVADLSILPQIVGANTNNTALTIGEKAADILIRELVSA